MKWKQWLAGMLTILMVIGCLGGSVSAKALQPDSKATDSYDFMQISDPILTLQVGEQKSLTILHASSSRIVHWFTMDADVADVEQSGMVTGVAPGIVTLYAVISKEHVLQCRVVVQPASHPAVTNLPTATTTSAPIATTQSTTTGTTPTDQPALSASTCTLSVGETFQLTATEMENVVWFSHDPQIASVTDGLITANQAGETIVYAIFPENVVRSCTVTIIQHTPHLSKEALTVAVGEVAPLTVLDLAPNQTVQWSSEDDTIADIIDETIIGVHPGTVVVSATIGENLVLSCTVTVQAASAQTTAIVTTQTESTITTTTTTVPIQTTTGTTIAAGPFLEQEYITMQMGDIQSMLLENIAADEPVSWFSKDETIATVDQQGAVTAVSTGNTRICAVIPGYGVLYCAVRVISDRAYDTGDVNGDGDITLADATLTLTYYAEEAVSGHPQFSDMIVCDEASAFSAADVDQDRTITLSDATLILTYYAELAVGNTPDWNKLRA